MIAQNALKEWFISNTENEAGNTNSRKLHKQTLVLKVHRSCCQTARWSTKTQYKYLGTRKTCQQVNFCFFKPFFLEVFFKPATHTPPSAAVHLIDTNTSFSRSEHCWEEGKQKKYGEQCSSTMQSEIKCFSHTESTSNSQSSNYALCSTIFHLNT